MLSANQHYLKLGQALGADGLLLVRTSKSSSAGPPLAAHLKPLLPKLMTADWIKSNSPRSFEINNGCRRRTFAALRIGTAVRKSSGSSNFSKWLQRSNCGTARSEFLTNH